MPPPICGAAQRTTYYSPSLRKREDVARSLGAKKILLVFARSCSYGGVRNAQMAVIEWYNKAKRTCEGQLTTVSWNVDSGVIDAMISLCLSAEQLNHCYFTMVK
jgi:hypothetical protein